MPASPWVGDTGELVAHVRSGDRVGISGFHFVRAPIVQLRALVETGLEDLTYVSWGGGVPLEFLLSHNAVRKAVFCFSSLDIFGLAPRFRRALEQDQIEVEERTALAFIKGLRAGLEQLPYELMQDPVESQVRGGIRGPESMELQGGPVATTEALGVDVFLLHAQRADEAGNVEILGARGLDLLGIFSAEKVLVTVEERVAEGSLGGRHGFILSRNFVTAVTVAPGGAWPTSCLPMYPTDYRALQAVADLPADQSIASALLTPPVERLQELHDVASLDPAAIVQAIRERPPYFAADTAEGFTVDELLVSAIARTVDDGSICSVGSVSPLATIAYLLAKHLWAPNTTIMSSNGSYLDVSSRPMSIVTAEMLDYHSAVAHISSDDSYHWYYQRGRITHEVVSSAQVDRRAATNTAWIKASEDRWIRLPGQGGMADVAEMHQRFFIYLPRHSTRTLVETVDFVTAKRATHGEQRKRLGYQPGPTTVLTNLGTFEYDTDIDELVLTHLHPGVAFEDLQQQTGFEVRRAAEVLTTPAPTAEELRVVREELDPLGVRRLEFVPSADRAALIEELLASEEELLAGLKGR